MAQQQELLQVQLGNETTWGVDPATPVGDWRKLPGITDVSLSPMIEIADFPTLEGLAPIYNAAIVKDGGEASISGILNFEDLPLWLDSLMGEDAVPVGAGAPYKYVYAAPHAAAVVDPKSYTLYYGTATSGYQLLGAMVNTLEISGSSGEALQLSLGFVGKQVVADAAPQTPVDRAVNMAIASDVALWIGNGLTGTYPGTAWTCTAYSFSISITANRSLIYALGSIVPCDTYHQRFDGTLDLTLEFPGDASKTKTLLNALLSGPTLQQQNIRLKVTLDATHSVQFDFAGTLMDPPDIFTDSDGISTVDMSWKGTYDDTQTTWLDVEVENAISLMWP